MLLTRTDSPLVIAHRGASGLAPENTLAAMELALDQGADALEFDVRLAGCGTPVVLHDPTLDRTTPWTGPVEAKSAADLAKCDAGHRFTAGDGGFPWRDRGVSVPTLAQVLARFPTTPLLLELKTAAAAGPVRRLIMEHGAANRVMLASFLEAALVPFRDGRFITSASRRGIFRLWLGSRLGLGLAGRDHAYSVPERYRESIPVPDRRFVRAAGKAGCPVHVWTVNQPDRAVGYWRRGVTGIITNYPGMMVAERERLGSAPSGPG